MRKKLRFRWNILAYSLAMGFASMQPVHAFNGIATDGTVGAAQILSAPGASADVTIQQNLGTTVGNNLFHSFSTFNIETGQTVLFQENTPNSLNNVVSRVTGGGASNLYGTLKSTPGGHADFYLINPSGIIFGANAQLDVAGAVHFSTADQLNFQDGSQFSATNPNASSLSATAPASFGFLGTSAVNNGLIAFYGITPDEKTPINTLDVVAGKITLDNKYTLEAPGGEIRMVAMQGAGEVGLDKSANGHLNLPTATPTAGNSGSIVIDGGSTVTSRGNGSGRVSMWGGDTIINNDSTISSSNRGITNATAENGVNINVKSLTLDNQALILSNSNVQYSGNSGDIHVAVTESLNVLNNSIIVTGVSYGGNGGDVIVKAGSILLDNASIGSSALNNSTGNATGNGGNVTVESSGSLNNINGGLISTDTWSSGNGGNLSVKAATIFIDKGNQQYNTGISSRVKEGAIGRGGTLSVESSGLLQIENGGLINSDTSGFGDAGNLSVKANEMLIGTLGNRDRTGIFSEALEDNTGHGGTLSVETNGLLKIENGGIIRSETFGSADIGKISVVSGGLLYIANGGAIANITAGSGNAGNLSVKAGSILLDGQGHNDKLTGILSIALPSSTSQAGSLDVESLDSIKIANGGSIQSTSFAKGNAGDVYVSAKDILEIDSGIASDTVFTRIASRAESGTGSAGTVTVLADKLNLFNRGNISTTSITAGNSGNISVNVKGLLTLDGKGSYSPTIISVNSDGTGLGGNVGVTAENLNIVNGGYIGSDTISKATAGNVNITVNDTFNIDNGTTDIFTGVSSSALKGSTGSAGIVNISADKLNIFNDGHITTLTVASGNAGDIFVNVNGSIMIDKKGADNPHTIYSDVRKDGDGKDGTGSAGNVEVKAGTLEINGGRISSDTLTSGNAGSVSVVSNDLLKIVNGGNISSSSAGSGNAGSVTTKAHSILIDGSLTGILTIAGKGNANAGTIYVEASDSLQIVNGGDINSSTSSSGNGNSGNIFVKADSILIDGKDYYGTGINTDTFGFGHAGTIYLESSGLLQLVNHGSVSSFTNGSGDAGSVSIKVGSILIDSQQDNNNITGILTTSMPKSTGHAGKVNVVSNNELSMNGGIIDSSSLGRGNAGSIMIDSPIMSLNNSMISAVTIGQGAAGNVQVQTTNLTMDNNASITAQAGSGSSGQTGDVEVTANQSISMNNSSISIQNDGISPNPKSVIPGLLSVSANDILMQDSNITSKSTQNVDASPIQIRFGRSLSLDPSFISTEANNGSGGSIMIQGDGILTLNHSGIRTSVTGNNGNGGDIGILTNLLMMNTGVVQANTSALGGTGGNVFLNVETLLPSGGMLILGGEPVNWDIHSNEFGWNVIQAAASGGVSGVINLTSPQLNLSGVLSNMGNPEFDIGTLSQDYCAKGTGSSLLRKGKGGMPAKSSDALLFY